ncbi:MAG TPA: hypothetical protein VFO86_15945 [Terriglobia bacterium]|nr:hypothetical protein [Terriglobia bacterium]
MKDRIEARVAALLALCLCLATPLTAAAAILQMRTVQSWDLYIQQTENRITGELKEGSRFLRLDRMKPEDSAKVLSAVRAGNVFSERMKTLNAVGREIDVSDGMIHHWYGAIFIPGIKVDPLLHWIQDYDDQYKYFKEVEKSKLLSHNGDTYRIYLRLTRTKVVTVHYNTEHTVIYRDNGPGRASSRSFTTKIAEIDDAGTAKEKEQPMGNDSGFMWRLNSYWRFREQDGGVFVECESVSLSREIPFGFGWLVGGYVESIPRESLESALTSIRDGVKTSR